MRVLLIGSGGREAALAWRLARCDSLDHLVVTGESAGWPDRAERVDASTLSQWVDVATAHAVDLVVVGPEMPLAAGVADALARAGVPCFGPGARAAQLESSKRFAKVVMRAAGVPHPRALAVGRGERDLAEARCAEGRVVIKADGLAAGKGVTVCSTPEEARVALEDIWTRFSDAADVVLLEDLLEGPEVSLFALSDGERVVPLPSAQDHKRLRDGGQGPNTGGMGAYAPCPRIDEERAAELVERIHAPVVAELAARGTPFRGVLYAGLMLTRQGPQVLEFNVRFGDPECQALMMLWEDDPLPWLLGAATGRLPAGRPRMRDGAACCVVLASEGYPMGSTRGVRIPQPDPVEGVEVFFAGARRVGELLETAGGRVLGVTGVGASLREARARAYAAVEQWRFPGARYRSDIGSTGGAAA